MRRLVVTLFIVMMLGSESIQAVDDPVVAFNRSETETLHSYKGTQRLEGTGMGLSGWIEASVELSPSGLFSYQITGEGGSLYVRKKVRMFLEGRKPNQKTSLSDFTTQNYNIIPTGNVVAESDLISLRLQPKRKEQYLIDGLLFVRQDGDLVRVEGKPAKSPSIWTSNEKIHRYYGRVCGVRVPIKMVLTADIPFLFTSFSLAVAYHYDEINGHKVVQ